MRLQDFPEGYIRNYDKERRGIITREGERVGHIHITLEVHDRVVRGLLGMYSEEQREWHDITFDAYQNVEMYVCPDCSVHLNLSPFGVKEDACEEHEIDEVRFVRP